MSATKRTQRRRAQSPGRRLKTAISREAQVAYTEVQTGVSNLEKSIADIRLRAARAERRVEADARRQIRELRGEARAQMKVLEARRREAARVLKKISVSAGESWRDAKRAADSILHEARTTAASVVDRFRRALKA
jgi:predicted  nucleic acid-binding Zn-ribbon protein